MGARELLNTLSGVGMSVTAEGDQLVVRPGSMLTSDLRDALREAKSELLTLLRGAPNSHQAGRAVSASNAAEVSLQIYAGRLAGLHWPRPEAGAFARRLVERDRSSDDRVSCIECRNYRLGACGNYERAGLGSREIGLDFAALLQRCCGFVPLNR